MITIKESAKFYKYIKQGDIFYFKNLNNKNYCYTGLFLGGNETDSKIFVIDHNLKKFQNLIVRNPLPFNDTFVLKILKEKTK